MNKMIHSNKFDRFFSSLFLLFLNRNDHSTNRNENKILQRSFLDNKLTIVRKNVNQR